MNKNIKVMGSVILSAVLAQSMLPFHVYALEDENPTQKTETVYAVLYLLWLKQVWNHKE